MVMEKVFHEKSSEEKILPEYLFHLEQIYIDRRSRSTRREPPTMGKQLVNFIACGCESSAPFFVIYKAGHKPMPYW